MDTTLRGNMYIGSVKCSITAEHSEKLVVITGLTGTFFFNQTLRAGE